MVGGYTLIDRPEVGNSVYIDISLREIYLDGGGAHERFWNTFISIDNPINCCNTTPWDNQRKQKITTFNFDEWGSYFCFINPGHNRLSVVPFTFIL